MTPSTKPVTRETTAFVREAGRMRAVVATITGGCVELRLKGTRQRETVELSGLWHQAVKARVWAERHGKEKGAGSAPSQIEKGPMALFFCRVCSLGPMALYNSRKG